MSIPLPRRSPDEPRPNPRSRFEQSVASPYGRHAALDPTPESLANDLESYADGTSDEALRKTAQTLLRSLGIAAHQGNARLSLDDVMERSQTFLGLVRQEPGEGYRSTRRGGNTALAAYETPPWGQQQAQAQAAPRHAAYPKHAAPSTSDTRGPVISQTDQDTTRRL